MGAPGHTSRLRDPLTPHFFQHTRILRINDTFTETCIQGGCMQMKLLWLTCVSYYEFKAVCLNISWDAFSSRLGDNRMFHEDQRAMRARPMWEEYGERCLGKEKISSTSRPIRIE